MYMYHNRFRFLSTKEIKPRLYGSPNVFTRRRGGDLFHSLPKTLNAVRTAAKSDINSMIEENPWPKIGATYSTEVTLQRVCNGWDLEPLDLLNGLAP